MHAELVEGVCTLHPFLLQQGYYALAEHQLRRAYTAAKILEETKAVIKLAWFLGEVSVRLGETSQARMYLQEGLRLARSEPTQPYISHFLAEHAWLAMSRGQEVQAHTFVQEGLRLPQANQQDDIHFFLLSLLAMILRAQGRVQEALQYMQEGKTLARMQGSCTGVCLLP